MSWSVTETGWGSRFFVEEIDGALTSGAIEVPGWRLRGRWPGEGRDDGNALLREACAQIRAYFAGTLQVFDLPCAPRGTEFQQSVWRLLMQIPYSQTRTYLQLSDELAMQNGARAVGTANGANPLPVIVPCHRVIATGGGLGGYAYGLELKRRLLELEGAKIGPLQEELFASSSHSRRRFSR